MLALGALGHGGGEAAAASPGRGEGLGAHFLQNGGGGVSRGGKVAASPLGSG